MARSSASSASRTARRPVLGHEEPRIFTPPLRKLTPKTSLGFAAIEFAEDVCGVTLYPWQKWLLVHALELHPDGGFRFRTIVVLVARQQGKSMLSVILSLFFMYILGRELVIGTAQDLDVAEEIWQEAVDLVEEVPDLDALKDRVIKVNGKKALELTTGERYKVKAANRRAGRGLSGELILLDELREHQSFDAWGAITKTTIARPDAQVWALSNAGDATSVVLRYLRQKAHAAVGDPDGINDGGEAPVDEDLIDDETDESTLAIFEWSAPPGAHTKDREAWAQANPALGHGFVTERTLASAEATDPEWVFRTECLCQWSDGTLEGPFPPGSWDAGRWDKDDPDPPQIVGKVRASVAVSHDRVKSYVAFAGHQADGSVQVELVAERAGTDWLEGWLSERVDVIEAVTGQAKGAPVSSLLADWGDKVGGIPVVPWGGSDLPSGTAKFYDYVRDGALAHNPWPSLDLAAATAVPKLTEGGAFMWDLKRSPNDAAPLQAATGAVWLLTRPVEAPAVSAYENRGVLTV